MQDKVYGAQEKVILHMDGDAFFVAVEIAKNPQLKGRPVVTGQERGIVSSFSYEAKALGIVRAMPIHRVKRDFPEVIVLSGDYRSYGEYSKKMFDIVRRYADDVEEYSIDECFADLTGLDKPLKMTYKEIALRIKKEVSEELGLSVTIGLAPNKVLAKIASKWVKPNGFTIITQETSGTYLSSFPIEKIWGIGQKSSEKLKQRGILTAMDFYLQDEGLVLREYSKPFYDIWLELHGKTVIQLNVEAKVLYASIQKTQTFHPATSDKDFLCKELATHIDDACNKARQYNLIPRKFSFFLKNQKLEYFHTSVVLPTPTNTPEALIRLAYKHLENIYVPGVLYRATGVTLQNLVRNDVVQLDLFGEVAKSDKLETIYKQLDALEEKFGRRIVHLASTKQQSDKEKEVGNDTERNLLFM